MKTLYDFILEAREYFNPNIPIEKLEFVFQTFFAGDEDPYDHDVDIYNELKPWLPKNITAGVLSSILIVYWYSKKGMNHQYSKAGVEKFVDFITSQPLARVEKILGAGGEGVVIELDKDKVIKILFDTDFMNSNETVLNTMRNMVGKKFETLPQIYKVTKHYIIRENVIPNTKRVKDFYTISQTKVFKLLSLEQCVARHLENGLTLTPEQEEVKNWLVKCREELTSIGHKIELNFDDFREANIGETKDGRIVYFDF